MIRKPAPRAQAHRGVALFILTLTILIAMIALAPLNGKGQPSGQSTHPGNRSQAKRAVSGSSQPSSPQFLPAVTYDACCGATSLAVADLNFDGKPDLITATCCEDNGDGRASVLWGSGDGTFQTAVAYDSGGQNAVSVAAGNLLLERTLQVVVANGCADKTACSGSGESGVGVLFGFFYPPPATYRSGGSVVQSVQIADVNNDGIPDLLVAHLCARAIIANCAIDTPSSVGVLLGHDGIFTLMGTYHTGGTQADSLAVADVNGDGQLDLVVGDFSSSNNVGVLLGNGNGTFKRAVSFFSGGSFPVSVAVADVNGDGKSDLVLANSGSETVGVLLGNGDGTFQAAASYGLGGLTPRQAAVADVNDDGIPDLIVATCCQSNGNGEVEVLLGKGDGTFQTALTFDSGGLDAMSVAVADVNGDGKPDIAVVNGSGVGVLLNNSGVHNPTSTSLASSLNPSTYGQKVTWTATVTSSGSVTPTGTIKFTWSGHTIGSATLNGSGVATLTRSNLIAATYPLTAVYAGDAANLGSTSAVLNQVVLETTSRASLTSSPNPSTQGQAVTFTATISSPTVIPTGPVTFTAGTTVLGTAQLAGGKAKLVISSLPVGSTKVTVKYNGDSNIAKSSASVIQTVQ
jgi:hypothetical protein